MKYTQFSSIYLAIDLFYTKQQIGENMIPIETLSIFIIASLGLIFSPGPDNIFILTQSALNGQRAGFLVTLGVGIGLLLHTALVSFGVAAIFATSATAFNVLKILGAAYLVYLAYQAFTTKPAHYDEHQTNTIAKGALFTRGVITNFTNPKVAIFFLAFLPQFANPAHGSLTLQMLTLGLIFMIITVITFTIISWFAARLGNWLRRSKRAQLWMNRVAGTVFIGLAFRLATTQR